MIKVLVFGGSGLVGSRFLELNKNIFEISSPDIEEVDILDTSQISKTIEDFNPAVVINFAAFTNVEGAEDEKDNKEGICYKINVIGARNVADACLKENAHLIHISTEYIFDGEKKDGPYTEEDQPHPINWYGMTKYLAEQAIKESGCQLTIIRICMPISSHYQLKKDVARFFLEQLKNNQPIKAIEDQQISPTLVDDIAAALQIICQKKKEGLYHVASSTQISPLNFAKLIADTFNLDSSLISPISFDEYNSRKKAKLLKNSALSSEEFVKTFGEGILHSVEDNVNIFKKMI